MLNLTNFVIDRVLRGTMFSSDDGSILWSVTQLSDPTLSIGVDNIDVLDNVGARIAQLDRSKSATLTATNAIFDMDLAAAQFGTTKLIADVGAELQLPAMEVAEIKTGDTTYELAHIPVGTAGAEIQFIYMLNNDSSLATRYELGAVASATEFTIDAATKTITLPTGLADKTRLLIPYEYDSQNAVGVVSTANDYPVAGRFVMDVIGSDVCNQSVKYHAWVVFPNAKLSAAVDISFSPDGGHPLEIAANQDYCDPEKRLFYIFITNE